MCRSASRRKAGLGAWGALALVASGSGKPEQAAAMTAAQE